LSQHYDASLNYVALTELRNWHSSTHLDDKGEPPQFPMNKNIIIVIAVAAIGAAVYFFTPLFQGDEGNAGGDTNQTEVNSTQ